MIPVRILGTASLQPGPAVTTEELCARVGRDATEVLRKTGIRSRHFAPPGTKAADVAAEALHGALVAAGLEAKALRRIFCVSSMGGDVTTPATANRVAAALGLSGSCDAMDLSNACMGFLSAFDLAARSVATGLGPVGVVSVELLSRTTTPDDPRPYLVLGDAAAAAVLGAGRPGEGVLGVALGNDGSLPTDVVLENPHATGKPERMRFLTPSKEMTRVALDALLRAARTVLEEAQVALRDVEWVLTHQPNGRMLEVVLDAMGVEAARGVRVVDTVGSVGSASLPTSLDRLWRTRPVKAGDRVLMVGVGAGVAHGAVLYRVGG
ncbi:ketoacyl-ACP synthase III [Myxococcus sp. CA051A]|uniref:Ketoacyl-ACP synthase III n=1 Tax=Myxococcus llanfairpwllgwyngyllgogerychwyrndrobwllllantysiliogogogochensis TaxID=2590453 RepID=A0A540WTR1_9BACT|nr:MULTISPECIES: 3-oxoacyl-[acyl-carrier-protein] synthase III C-terminal domain-containing protein [Myxococcus]NTX07596.1 ketoacyl-ACP synthase III [Myxococcus sp. CA040A]NTX10736.1 ketoacyl-ACP synthase III [Myxococcus sp. CA056]NTX37384.1 ketoacyl-ACP synthase III [Myxococcus sp. CA033]NTX56799.1 ketoacyl-ACP synthase III [Myxococcus sp. CA039A]NTX66071.1 ketoacyl-ACP synthase III [Myxococcus sp. CA051A]